MNSMESSRLAAFNKMLQEVLKRLPKGTLSQVISGYLPLRSNEEGLMLVGRVRNLRAYEPFVNQALDDTLEYLLWESMSGIAEENKESRGTIERGFDYYVGYPQWDDLR